MRSLKIKLAVFMTFLFVPLAVFANGGGGLVGNGGDGVIRNGRLVVRDIADLNEWDFTDRIDGKAIDPKIVETIETSATFLFTLIDHQLLTQQLAKLQKVDHELPFLILKAIESYNFRFSDEPLDLLPDPTWDDENDPRTPIAVRIFGNIWVRTSDWHRLDARNKIALVLHEAMFSLVRIESRDGYSYQDGARARSLTKKLFSLKETTLFSYKKELFDSLNVGPVRSARTEIQVTLEHEGGAISPPLLLPLSAINKAEIEDFFTQWCEVDYSTNHHNCVSFKISIRWFEIESVIYDRPTGPETGRRVAAYQNDLSIKLIGPNEPSAVKDLAMVTNETLSQARNHLAPQELAPEL